MEPQNTYLVLEHKDIEAALSLRGAGQLEHLINIVRNYRYVHGKPDNHYVVINQDEPYFPDVLKLMEVAENDTSMGQDGRMG